MVMTIDIPEKVVHEAAARGVSVETFLRDAFVDGLTQGRFVRPDTFKKSQDDRDTAAAKMREIAARNTLGGLKIKDLVNEGRKY